MIYLAKFRGLTIKFAFKITILRFLFFDLYIFVILIARNSFKLKENNKYN